MAIAARTETYTVYESGKVLNRTTGNVFSLKENEDPTAIFVENELFKVLMNGRVIHKKDGTKWAKESARIRGERIRNHFDGRLENIFGMSKNRLECFLKQQEKLSTALFQEEKEDVTKTSSHALFQKTEAPKKIKTPKVFRLFGLEITFKKQKQH